MMVFYLFVGFGMLLHLVASLPQDVLDVTQPPSPTLHCQQLSPVHRPKGAAVLICEVFGIRSDEMRFHWWLDVTPTNIQTPIYTYSAAYGVDDITPMYRDMVVNETHVISERHMTSEMKLFLNMTTNGVFRFEVTMNSHQTYADKMEISFEDPQITLDLKEMPKIYADGSNSTILLVATCQVDACFGKPTMSISCNNIEDAEVTVIHEESQLDHQPTYFNGRHRIVMIHQNCLQVICLVTDERGTYQATRNITQHDNFMLTAPAASLSGKENHKILILGIVQGLAIVLLAINQIRMMRNVKHTKGTQEGSTKKPMLKTQKSSKLVKSIKGVRKLSFRWRKHDILNKQESSKIEVP